MNPLMHSTFSTQLLTDAGISGNHHDVILGSVLPDLSILGVIPEKDAHNRGIEFLDYLSHNAPDLIPFGIGFVLHGEFPQCLDYYTHRKKGYIDQKRPSILDLAQEHKINFDGIDADMLSHILTEFACDSLADKTMPKQLHTAFKQTALPPIAFHLAKFFNGDQQRINRILTFFKHFNFNKLRTMHGIANTLQDFMIYQRFANKGVLNTYKYLWVRVNPFKTHRVVQLLKDVRDVVKEDCHDFLAKSQTKIYRTVVRKSLGGYL